MAGRPLLPLRLERAFKVACNLAVASREDAHRGALGWDVVEPEPEREQVPARRGVEVALGDLPVDVAACTKRLLFSMFVPSLAWQKDRFQC